MVGVAEQNAHQVRALVASVIANGEFDGKPELLAQVPFVLVVGGRITFLDLAVDVEDQAVPRSAIADGPVPGRCWVFVGHGEPIGGLLVWVTGGYISGLEYFCSCDESPTRLPSTSQLSHDQV